MSRKYAFNLAASVLTFFMGFSHFFVPLFLPWEQHAADLYAPISWALYAMNFSFSYLLTLGGILTYVSFNHIAIRKWIVGGMASFWIAGGVYQLVIPFPLDEARWILPVISFVIAILYLAVLFPLEKVEQQ
ncbi:hypothetical protein [Candidatus Contubernalis alkaliaceticus]|uniref:hypothetical protein n=1 Tax=Candidatus Contubernalis alkaliaceticus TaxID=338645 RepID=UPI001F4C4631|nr:hypothetical protein [Candidatus Contubernalis alkalaceticus]UNC92098.1 hypothetical protein HUE98_08305 [Candidatus Contubernalis alkalaceticus]